ncbi:hypothetical protein OF001_U620002 [Pseudomonas sp. OF001]|nr:hypothetical protein OF001_U620002 [Pseudomonas sp. OF001]
MKAANGLYWKLLAFVWKQVFSKVLALKTIILVKGDFCAFGLCDKGKVSFHVTLNGFSFHKA